MHISDAVNSVVFHRNFGLAKKLVRGPKFQEKWSASMSIMWNGTGCQASAKYTHLYGCKYWHEHHCIRNVELISWGKMLTLKLGHFFWWLDFVLSVCQESDVSYVPCSGMMGENLLDPPAATTCTEWYKGPTLLDRIGQHFHESTPHHGTPSVEFLVLWTPLIATNNDRDLYPPT